jgi:hypothetical protein
MARAPGRYGGEYVAGYRNNYTGQAAQAKLNEEARQQAEAENAVKTAAASPIGAMTPQTQVQLADLQRKTVRDAAQLEQNAEKNREVHAKDYLARSNNSQPVQGIPGQDIAMRALDLSQQDPQHNPPEYWENRLRTGIQGQLDNIANNNQTVPWLPFGWGKQTPNAPNILQTVYNQLMSGFNAPARPQQ